LASSAELLPLNWNMNAVKRMIAGTAWSSTIPAATAKNIQSDTPALDGSI